MLRRNFLPFAAAPLLGAAAKPSNVILILTDDQGYGDFSLRRNPFLQTPNLDRLAAEGAEFTRFSVSPVCSPTRAALMTGRYPLRTGVHGVTKGRETMRMNEVTLAQSLKAAGYRTALMGKWHLGENYPYVPHARGFDEFVGFRPGHWNWYFNSPAEHNGKAVQLKVYVADALTDESIRFIDQARRDPFFLYLAYNTPHAPYQVPDTYYDRFAGKGLAADTQAVYGMVANLDDNIGRVLAHLDKRGLAEDTIVVFLCDNGPQTDRFVAGLRGRKGSIYEGGTRSPLYMRWPKKIAVGRKIDRLCGHIDVLPTLLDLCQVKRLPGPELDGISLRPLLEGQPASDRTIFTHADQQADPTKPWPGCARTQRFKMANGKELYDLLADPGESTNIAGQHPEVLARLNREYEHWFSSTLDGFSAGAPPVPIGYAEENPAVLSAPQAELSGGMRFWQKNGYAHDFVTGWGAGGELSWRVDAHRAGNYALTALYRGPVGTKIEMNGVGAMTVEAVAMDEIALPHRTHNGAEAPAVHWQPLDLGRLRLGTGVGLLRLEQSGPAADIKAVHCKFLS